MKNDAPRLLVIDTSGSSASVEAWTGATRSACETFGAARHVQALTSRLKCLLANAEWTLPSVDAIIVNIGPGSFTGVRVGLATAKALAFVDRQKLIGVDSFDAWAAGVPLDPGSVFDIVMEGQLQTVNVVRYEMKNGEHVRRPLRTLPRDRIAHEFDCGVAVASPWNSLKQLLPNGIPWLDVQPQTAFVGRSRFITAQFDDLMTIEPYYVRPSSAEEKWESASRRPNASPASAPRD